MYLHVFSSFQNCNNHCVCEDSKNNSFGCVIQVTDTQTLKYCEFQDSEVNITLHTTCFKCILADYDTGLYKNNA